MNKEQLRELLCDLEAELVILDKDNPDVDSLINTLEIVIEKAKNYKGE